MTLVARPAQARRRLKRCPRCGGRCFLEAPGILDRVPDASCLNCGHVILGMEPSAGFLEDVEETTGSQAE